LGTMAGGLLAKWFHGRQAWSGVAFIVLAGIGLLTSMGISRVPPANPAKKFRFNMAGDLWAQSSEMREDRVLWLALLGNVYFWFLASLLLLNIVLYANDTLRVDETHASLLLVALSLGIGLGSFAAGYLSGGKIEYGLIPLGAIGMTVLGLCLAIPDLSFRTVLLLLAALGFFGGFFIVPISALIQHQPEEDKKGVVIGTA